MSLATFTSKDVSVVQKLIERKEALTSQIAEINSELEAIEAGTPKTSRAAATSKAAGPAIPRGKRGGAKAGRGHLKEQITSELQAAGGQGVKVKDLATKLGKSYGNVTAFFQSTGKKIREIKKVGRGQYAWKGA